MNMQMNRVYVSDGTNATRWDIIVKRTLHRRGRISGKRIFPMPMCRSLPRPDLVIFLVCPSYGDGDENDGSGRRFGVGVAVVSAASGVSSDNTTCSRLNGVTEEGCQLNTANRRRLRNIFFSDYQQGESKGEDRQEDEEK